MNKKILLLGLSACFFTGATFASSLNDTLNNLLGYDWAWVSTLSMGPAWERGGQSESFYLAPGIEKTYSANKSTNAVFDGEFFLGVQKPLSQVIASQLGLAVAATSNARLSGAIWDDASPQFNNYTYHYNVSHTHLAVKGKLLADKGYWVMPWISASLGIGFNNAHGFSSTPTIFEALPTPGFSSNTQSSFTYSVGVGVQKKLNHHWQAGLGYEFADWGSSQLSKAPGQTLNQGLSLSHLYTNSLLFNVTYLG